MLGGFGFELLRFLQVRHQREVNHHVVARPQFPAGLPHGLHKGQRLDIAHAAADFGDHHVVVAGVAQPEEVGLNLVGDVGDHLHGFAQEVAAALFGDHVVVDAAGGHVVVLRGAHVEETLVVAQVQVGFGPVVGHVALPVFVGIHGAGVDVDVGIELLDGDAQSAGLQEFAKRCGDNAFAEGGRHPTGHKNVLYGTHKNAAYGIQS